MPLREAQFGGLECAVIISKFVTSVAYTVVFWAVITGWCTLERPRVTSSLVTESKNSWNGWRKNCYSFLPHWNDKCLENSKNFIEVPKKKIFMLHKISSRPVSSWIWVFLCWFEVSIIWLGICRQMASCNVNTNNLCRVIGLCSNWGNTEGLGKRRACQNLVSVYTQLIPFYSKLSFSSSDMFSYSDQVKLVCNTEKWRFVGQPHLPVMLHWYNKEKVICEYIFELIYIAKPPILLSLSQQIYEVLWTSDDARNVGKGLSCEQSWPKESWMGNFCVLSFFFFIAHCSSSLPFDLYHSVNWAYISFKFLYHTYHI